MWFRPMLRRLRADLGWVRPGLGWSGPRCMCCLRARQERRQVTLRCKQGAVPVVGWLGLLLCHVGRFFKVSLSAKFGPISYEPLGRVLKWGNFRLRPNLDRVDRIWGALGQSRDISTTCWFGRIPGALDRVLTTSDEVWVVSAKVALVWIPGRYLGSKI